MLLDLIKNRASIRDYSTRVIDENNIDIILEAGRLAPSWINVQPWHFISIKNQDTKNLLSELANNQKQIKEASHVIVMLADFTAWEDKKFKKVMQKREGMDNDRIDFILNSPILNPTLRNEEILMIRTVEQCTYAMAYMTLQAKDLGIDSCIVGALGNELTNFNLELLAKVKKDLMIPDKNYIIGFLTLGYKKEESKTPTKYRKDFEEVVSKEKYGLK